MSILKDALTAVGHKVTNYLDVDKSGDVSFKDVVKKAAQVLPPTKKLEEAKQVVTSPAPSIGATVKSLLPKPPQVVTNAVKDTYQVAKTAAVAAPKVYKAVTSVSLEAKKQATKLGVELAKSTARAPVKFATAVGLEPAAASIELATGKKTPAVYEPKSRLEKALFGNEPIKGAFTASQDWVDRTSEYLVSKGLSPKTSQALSLTFVPVIYGGLGSLDLLPLTNPEGNIKNAASALAKINKTENVLEILRPLVGNGIRDVEEVAGLIAKTKDPKKIEEVLNFVLKQIDEDKRLAKEVASQAPKIADEIPKTIPEAIDVVRGAEGVAPRAAETAEDLKGILPKLADDAPKPPRSGDQVLQEFAEKIVYDTPKPTKSTITELVRSGVISAREALVTKYARFGELESNVLREAGESLKPGALTLDQHADLLAGISGRAELDQIDLRRNVLDLVKDSFEEFSQYLALNRARARVATGKKKARVGTYTLAELEEAQKALEKKVGIKTYQKFIQAGENFQKMAHDSLDLLENAGVLSKEQVTRIKGAQDFYAPFKVIQDVDEELKSAVAQRRDFAVPKEALPQKLKGLATDDFKIQDPSTAFSQQILRVRNAAENNLFKRRVADLVRFDPEGKFIFKVADPTVKNEKQNLKIALNKNKRLRDFVGSVLTKSNRKIRDLQREINNLNKRGLKESLRPTTGPVGKFLTSTEKVPFLRKSLEIQDSSPKGINGLDVSNQVKALLETRFGSYAQLVEAVTKGETRTLYSDIKGIKDLDVSIQAKALLNRRFGSLKQVAEAVAEGGAKALTKRGVNKKTAEKIVEQITKKGTQLPPLKGPDLLVSKGLSKETSEKIIEQITATPSLVETVTKETFDLINKIPITSTRATIEHLITLPKNQVEMVKKMIMGRENKLEPLFKQVDFLRETYSKIKETRSELFSGLVELTQEEKALVEKAKKQGFITFSVFEDGEKATYAVDASVSKALSGLNTQQLSSIEKGLSYLSRPFKFGAITANTGFQTGNFFIDNFRNFTLNKYIGLKPAELVKFPIDFMRGVMAAASYSLPYVHPNKLMREFMESGAFGTTIARVLDPKDLTKGVNTTKVRSILGLPKETLTRTSEFVELLPKLTGFQPGKRAVVRGEATMEEVANEVRRFAGSPDFARSGVRGRQLGVIFTFFNARIQGTAADVSRLFTPVKKGAGGKYKVNKDAMSSWLKIAGTVLTPAAVLQAYNLRPENREDHEKIPQSDRDSYFHIPKSALYGLDDPRAYFKTQEGEVVRDYWKFQKREFVQLFGNLTESIVTFIHDRDPKQAGEMFKSFIEGVTPINIAGDSLKERGQSIVSSTNPVLKLFIEHVTGIDTFTKRGILPEYIGGRSVSDLMLTNPEDVYRKSTPEVYIDLAQMLKQYGLPTTSPLLIQHFAEGYTGGLARQLFPAEGKTGERETLDPIAARFHRSVYSQPSKREQQLIDLVNTARSDDAAARLEDYRRAQSIFTALPKAKTQGEAAALLDGVSKGTLTELEKIIQDEAANQSFTDARIENIPTNSGKARFIFTGLNTLKGEDRKDFLRRLVEQKILTKGVEAELEKLIIAEGAQNSPE